MIDVVVSNRMRPRLLLAVAGGIALAVAAFAVLSPTGLPRLWKLDDEEKALRVDVDRAHRDNDKLAAEVKILQGGEPSSAAVLEKHAREELGYVKADEVVLTGLPTFKGPASSSGATGANGASGASAP